MKILLLDDYAQPRTDARKALEQILADEAPEFSEFSNPFEALESFKQISYDLVVADILIPEMNGFEFSVKALKNRVVPVVMHTGTWSKEYVTQIILNGIGEKLPIEIVGKRYFHESEEEYVSELKRGIEHSKRKAEKLQPNVFESCIGMIRQMVNYVAGSEVFHNNKLGIEVKDIEKINEKLRAKDDFLVDYIKAVFKELVTTLNTTAGLLHDDKVDCLKKRILGIEWTSDEKSKTTSDYMHHFSGYPLPSLCMILERYGKAERETSPKIERESKAVVENENEVLRKIKDIYEKMRAIEQVINDQRYMIIANPQEKRMYQRRLETQERVPLPKPELPVKLVNRIKMLQYYSEDVTSNASNWLIITPHDEPGKHEESVSEMMEIFGPKLIARSMFRGEDSLLPMAGFFDSVVFNSVKTYYDAVEEIRAMNSRHLAQFCLHRGFQLPSREDMFIGIEPYFGTTHLGSIIEHPNFPGVYLIEFGKRVGLGNSVINIPVPRVNNWVNAKQILYDANNERVLNHNVYNSEQINVLELSKTLSNIYKNWADETDGEVPCSKQVEFGFSEEMYKVVTSYQLRNFRQKTPVKDFMITQPYKATSVMGTTEQEGIECVVIKTTDAIEFGVLAEKARNLGYGVCYVISIEKDTEAGEGKKEADNVAVASLVPNVDLLVVGKDLRVMSHGYFNAMVNARNVLLLEPSQHEVFGFEQGSIVNYTCNGTDCSIKKVDTSERIKYQIREVLNR